MLAALCGLALPLLTAVAPAQANVTTFSYTGGEQTFTVPAGVHRVGAAAVGGKGGAGSSAGGGLAVALTGILAVTPGETLYVEVGGNGQSGPSGGVGGFNGGGDGSSEGGGGGGASDVRTAPRSAGLSPDTRLIVAGGGAGGGGSGATLGGGGGGAGEPGEEGAEGSGNLGGEAGKTSEGGAGSGGGFGCHEAGLAGELGVGGHGGAGESTNGGGGGGGGFWGGGGGGGGCFDGGGGGGGGSSRSPGISIIATTPAPAGVSIAYTPPPSIEIDSPAAGATYAQGQTVTAAYSCAANEGIPLTSCAGPVANGAPIDTAAPGSHSFTVHAEDAKLGQSSKTVTYTVKPATTPPGPAPNTSLGSHPKKVIKTLKKKVKVRFTFSSDAPAATFMCRLDRAPFAPCASPKAYRARLGKHVFSVEAVLGGVVDPTPATFRFKVRKRG